MMNLRGIPNEIESLRRYLAGHPEHQPVTPRGPGLGLGGRPGAAASTSAMRAIGDLGIEASAIQCSVFRELRPEFRAAAVALLRPDTYLQVVLYPEGWDEPGGAASGE